MSYLPCTFSRVPERRPLILIGTKEKKFARWIVQRPKTMFSLHYQLTNRIFRLITEILKEADCEVVWRGHKIKAAYRFTRHWSFLIDENISLYFWALLRRDGFHPNSSVSKFISMALLNAWKILPQVLVFSLIFCNNPARGTLFANK